MKGVLYIFRDSIGQGGVTLTVTNVPQVAYNQYIIQQNNILKPHRVIWVLKIKQMCVSDIH